MKEVVARVRDTGRLWPRTMRAKEVVARVRDVGRIKEPDFGFGQRAGATLHDVHILTRGDARHTVEFLGDFV